MLEDMPAGWALGGLEDEEESESEAEPNCSDEVFIAAGIDDDSLESADPTVTATNTFSQAALGPFLVVAVTRADRASDLFDVMPEALAACDGEVDEDGAVTRVLPVSFPNLGDDTFATRLDIESGFFAVSALLAMVRHGDVVLMSFSLAVGSAVDAELVEWSLRMMGDRL